MPVDVAFEVAGDDDAIADAIAAVRPGGRVVLVGIPDDDRTQLPGRRCPAQGAVAPASAAGWPQTDLPRAIELAEAGRVDLVGADHPSLSARPGRRRRSPCWRRGAASRSS